MEPGRSSLLKLQRAYDQTTFLQGEIERFQEERPWTLGLEPDTVPSQLNLVIRMTRQPPADLWGVYIGEILQHFRSALDHLVWELSLHDLNLPPNAEKPAGIEFPVFIEEARFDSRSRGGGLYKIRRVRPEGQTIIKELQPFRVGAVPEQTWPWVLHLLANIDKHRALNLCHQVGRLIEPKALSDTGSLKVRQMGSIQPFKDQTTIAQVELTDPFAFGQINFDWQIAYYVVFDESGPASGMPVIDCLREMGRYVSTVRARLIPLLS